MFDRWLCPLLPGNTHRGSPSSFNSRSRASARRDRGTRCSRPAFIRSGGMIQTPSLKSNSRHSAAVVSDVRVAVSIKNSRARAERLRIVRSCATKAGNST